MRRPEFHDLADASALNHESDGGARTHWGNLGHWSRPGMRYAQACAQLADRTVAGLQLGPATRLVDVGFGCGEQVLHWIRRYGVREIDGLNVSCSQTALARERLAQAGHPDVARRLQQGSATDLHAWWSARALADAVVALDCAYHFAPSREDFLHQAARVLRRGGRLALSDLVLARDDLSLRQRTVLAGMARLSRIPQANLLKASEPPNSPRTPKKRSPVSVPSVCSVADPSPAVRDRSALPILRPRVGGLAADDYRAQLERAGFEIERFEDVTSSVFTPFGEWLARYRAGLDPAIRRRIGWTKYRATAAFLRWAQEERVLRYVLCTARLR